MFFQNPFAEEFRGVMPAAPAQGIGPDGTPTFKCPQNIGRAKDSVLAWGVEPFNLSGADYTGIPNNRNNLTLNYALGSAFNYWNSITININSLIANYTNTYTAPNYPDNLAIGRLTSTLSAQGVTSTTSNAFSTQVPAGQTWSTTTTPVITALKASEVVMLLNSNTNFSSFFLASIYTGPAGNQISIKQKFPVTQMKFYVVNGGAEEVFRFNDRAGVAELPEYFLRHCVGNYSASYNPTATAGTTSDFPDNLGSLVLLTPSIYTNTPMYTGAALGFPLATAITNAVALSGSAFQQTITSSNNNLQTGSKIAVVKSDCGTGSPPAPPSIDNVANVSSTVTAGTATIASVGATAGNITGWSGNASGGSGYPISSLILLQVMQTGGSGGIISLTTTSSGTLAGAAITTVSAGSGYTAGAVTLSSGNNYWIVTGPNPATATVTLTNGVISAPILVNGTVGLQNCAYPVGASYLVQVAGGNNNAYFNVTGTGTWPATALAYNSLGSGGSGYISTTVSLSIYATATITTNNGQITGATIYSQGCGYPPSSTFNLVVGGGIGGVIQVTTSAAGVMSAVTSMYSQFGNAGNTVSGCVVNAGTNYAAGVVTLSNPYFSIATTLNTTGNQNLSLNSVNIGGTRGYWTTMTNYNVIANAKDNKGNLLNYSFNNMREDYQLLNGTVAIYNFQNVIMDPLATATLRPLQIITYPAGAGVGYVAAKLMYYYADKSGAGTDTLPTRTCQIPYVLKAIDLIAPQPGSTY